MIQYTASRGFAELWNGLMEIFFMEALAHM